MHATRKGRLRGTGPVGVISPSGVSTLTTSPTQARSWCDISLPMQMPARLRSASGSSFGVSSGCA